VEQWRPIHIVTQINNIVIVAVVGVAMVTVLGCGRLRLA
jgi:hypothetical protein